MTDNEAPINETEAAEIRALLPGMLKKNPALAPFITAVEEHLDRGTEPVVIRAMVRSLLTALGGADGR